MKFGNFWYRGGCKGTATSVTGSLLRIFSDNVEDRLGSLKFFALIVGAAFLGDFVHIALWILLQFFAVY